MRQRGAALAVGLVGGWAVLVGAGSVHPAAAQVGTSTTSRPSTTLLPPTSTTEPPSTTTTHPATTLPPATSSPTTRPARSSTTAAGSTSSTARATLPPPPGQGGGPPASFAAKNHTPNGSMSPALAFLSGIGLVTGFGLLALQWYLTRPDRQGWTL